MKNAHSAVEVHHWQAALVGENGEINMTTRAEDGISKSREVFGKLISICDLPPSRGVISTIAVTSEPNVIRQQAVRRDCSTTCIA